MNINDKLDYMRKNIKDQIKELKIKREDKSNYKLNESSKNNSIIKIKEKEDK